MDQDKIKYILDYYSYWMTIEEKIAWRHWASLFKMQNSSKEHKERRIKISLKKGWMTENEEVLKLLDDGIDVFRERVAMRIDREHAINYNNCPKCQKLTRTPKAKQCRFCGHNWH